jgi:hypothetical protein
MYLLWWHSSTLLEHSKVCTLCDYLKINFRFNIATCGFKIQKFWRETLTMHFLDYQSHTVIDTQFFWVDQTLKYYASSED